MPKRNLSWLKEVLAPDLLSGDERLIAEYCGIDTLISLWENLAGLNLYISGAPIMKARKRYIQTFYNGRNAKELAALLGVSDRFVYQVVRERKGKKA